MNKKFITSLIIASALPLTCVNAANFFVSNLITGTGASDTLFQNAGNTSASLLNGGIVTLGYFGSNAYAPSSSLSSINTTISDFTVITSALTGTPLYQLNPSSPPAGGAGYVDSGPPFDGAAITTGNALIGRTVYAFVGNGATLAASTAWALYSVGVITDETAAENTFTASATGTTPIIGQINLAAFTGQASPSLGSSTYNTIQLQAIPEPSTFLLASLGVIALLRRRR